MARYTATRAMCTGEYPWVTGYRSLMRRSICSMISVAKNFSASCGSHLMIPAWVLRKSRQSSAVKDSKRTLADWLALWRVTALAASDRKESTRELYANLCRRHLEPKPFGAIRLDKLKPSDIETLVLAMRAKTKPGKRTEKDLNPESAPRYEDGQIANWRSRHIVAGGEWGMSLAEVYEWLTGGDQ